MDLNAARFNMVQQQVRTWDVLDPKILTLLMAIPREQFVLPHYQQLAFSDTQIPIGSNQVTLPPKMIGRLLQALKVTPQDTVLEIGTGTGYITALLAHLAKKVISIEILPELSQRAAELLVSFKHNNCHLEVGDAALGWPTAAPFDVMLFTGSLPYLPNGVQEQLAPNGRLFAIIGIEPVMSALLITRRGSKDKWTEHVLFETVIPPLVNVPKPKGFGF